MGEAAYWGNVISYSYAHKYILLNSTFSKFQSGIYTCRYKDEIGQTISGTFIIIN